MVLRLHEAINYLQKTSEQVCPNPDTCQSFEAVNCVGLPFLTKKYLASYILPDLEKKYKYRVFRKKGNDSKWL